MNKIRLSDNGTDYVRINKHAARKAFNAGKPIIFCPVKLYPFGGFRPSVMIQKSEDYSDFEKVVDNFIWYNCQLNETGFYPAYYVSEGV